jgi:hypothetical protein
MDYSLFFGLIIGSGIPAAVIGVVAGLIWLFKPEKFRMEHWEAFNVAGLCFAVCLLVLIVALGVGEYLNINYRPT